MSDVLESFAKIWKEIDEYDRDFFEVLVGAYFILNFKKEFQFEDTLRNGKVVASTINAMACRALTNVQTQIQPAQKRKIDMMLKKTVADVGATETKRGSDGFPAKILVALSDPSYTKNIFACDLKDSIGYYYVTKKHTDWYFHVIKDVAGKTSMNENDVRVAVLRGTSLFLLICENFDVLYTSSGTCVKLGINGNIIPQSRQKGDSATYSSSNMLTIHLGGHSLQERARKSISMYIGGGHELISIFSSILRMRKQKSLQRDVVDFIENNLQTMRRKVVSKFHIAQASVLIHMLESNNPSILWHENVISSVMKTLNAVPPKVDVPIIPHPGRLSEVVLSKLLLNVLNKGTIFDYNNLICLADNQLELKVGEVVGLIEKDAIEQGLAMAECSLMYMPLESVAKFFDIKPKQRSELVVDLKTKKRDLVITPRAPKTDLAGKQATHYKRARAIQTVHCVTNSQAFKGATQLIGKPYLHDSEFFVKGTAMSRAHAIHVLTSWGSNENELAKARKEIFESNLGTPIGNFENEKLTYFGETLEQGAEERAAIKVTADAKMKSDAGLLGGEEEDY